MSQIILSSAFQRQLKQLLKQNPKLKPKVAQVLKLLIQDLHHPSLKLHKLFGQENWSVSLTYDLRIIIHREQDQVFCLRLGTHNQVY